MHSSVTWQNVKCENPNHKTDAAKSVGMQVLEEHHMTVHANLCTGETTLICPWCGYNRDHNIFTDGPLEVETILNKKETIG